VTVDRRKRAALYARVSTRQQADVNGVAAQLDALQRLAEHRQWEVVEYVDEARSGRTTDDRPALARLRAAAIAGELDVVCVLRFDRLARSLEDLIAIAGELKAAHVDLVSVHEQLDTTTAVGRLHFQLFGALAEFEAALTRERVREGIQAARARGQAHGRPRALLTPAQALQAIRDHGGVRAAARALGVTKSLVQRRLAEAQASSCPGR
jgi:DNA invertase Pin-like site-specific DNA recombinase